QPQQLPPLSSQALPVGDARSCCPSSRRQSLTFMSALPRYSQPVASGVTTTDVGSSSPVAAATAAVAATAPSTNRKAASSLVTRRRIEQIPLGVVGFPVRETWTPVAP